MNWSRTIKTTVATVCLSSLLIVPNGIVAASSDTTNSAVAQVSLNQTIRYKWFSGSGDTRREAKSVARQSMNFWAKDRGFRCRAINEKLTPLAYDPSGKPIRWAAEVRARCTK